MSTSAIRTSRAVVLVALAVVVVGTLGGGEADADHIGPLLDEGWRGVLRSAGFLFFAFAGYARIATLGGEVVEPERTIPRAIPIALGIALGCYAVVTLSALAAVGPEVLARSAAPLSAAVEAGGLDRLVPAVRIGGAFAALGVLLSLVAGVSRTTYAMAGRRDLPGWLDSVHPSFRTPHRAEVAVGAVVCVLVLATDVREVIGFSSFTVLVYYGIANAAALTLPEPRRWRFALAVLGIAGCAVLALTLPAASVLTGTGVLAVGAVTFAARLRSDRRSGPPRA